MSHFRQRVKDKLVCYFGFWTMYLQPSLKSTEKACAYQSGPPIKTSLEILQSNIKAYFAGDSAKNLSFWPLTVRQNIFFRASLVFASKPKAYPFEASYANLKVHFT